MKPPYEKPEIVTRSADEILEILGPVQGYGGGGTGTDPIPMIPAGSGHGTSTPRRR